MWHALPFFLMRPLPPRSTLFPYTTLFRSLNGVRSWFVGERRFRLFKQFKKQAIKAVLRSEEHTSELQSRENLVCRLLLEKKNDRDGADHVRRDPRSRTSLLVLRCSRHVVR